MTRHPSLSSNKSLKHLTWLFCCRITGQYWAESPTVTRKGKQWILYFDKYTQHQMGAVGSSDLINRTDFSDQVLFPSGTRHGTVFKVSADELAKLR